MGNKGWFRAPRILLKSQSFQSLIHIFMQLRPTYAALRLFHPPFPEPWGVLW
jgi:hypothetical protein